MPLLSSTEKKAERLFLFPLFKQIARLDEHFVEFPGLI